jgi:hypothetical protein
VDDFYELRDWGGVLGGLNVRMFFGVDKQNRAIVILGALKKKNDGATPTWVKIKISRRWKAFLNGSYGTPS